LRLCDRLSGGWPRRELLEALAFFEEVGGAGRAAHTSEVAWVDKLTPLILACVAVVGALGSAVRVDRSGAVAVNHFTE